MSPHEEAAKRGDDEDFLFFHRNPRRLYRIRRAHPFECTNDTNTHILARWFQLDGSMIVEQLEVRVVDGATPDVDRYLVEAWSKVQEAIRTGNPSLIGIERDDAVPLRLPGLGG